MKAALIYGHPTKDSFNAFLATETKQILKNKGFEVKEYDVYQYPLMQRNPSQNGFSDEWKALSQELAEVDAWIIICPMWNYTMPAGLKNFFDGIFQAGTYFKFLKYGIPKGLLNVKKATLIWTSGSPGYAIRLLRLDHLVSLTKSMCKFVGIKKFQQLNFGKIRNRQIPQPTVDKWIRKIEKLKFI